MGIEKIVEQRIEEADSLSELAFILKNLLAYHAVWEDGSLYSIRKLVAYVDGLKIEIYHDEHPPPHFHVTAADLNASFTIEGCKLLEGSIGGREKRIVEWWYKRSRAKLIHIWNETRPSDCKVGPIQHE
jgi:hypothetical protein